MAKAFLALMVIALWASTPLTSLADEAAARKWLEENDYVQLTSGSYQHIDGPVPMPPETRAAIQQSRRDRLERFHRYVERRYGGTSGGADYRPSLSTAVSLGRVSNEGRYSGSLADGSTSAQPSSDTGRLGVDELQFGIGLSDSPNAQLLNDPNLSATTNGEGAIQKSFDGSSDSIEASHYPAQSDNSLPEAFPDVVKVKGYFRKDGTYVQPHSPSFDWAEKVAETLGFRLSIKKIKSSS